MPDSSSCERFVLPPLTEDTEAKLRAQVTKWKEMLLDLGNRNPLINCSFNATRGVLELVHPQSEDVWRKLVSESEAGIAPMRFPWRRDLVPPPPVPEQPVDLDVVHRQMNVANNGGIDGVLVLSTDSDCSNDDLGVMDDAHSDLYLDKQAAKRWHPPLEECLASRRFGSMDLMTESSDPVLDRRLRTLESHAQLSMSEQGVHCLYIAFGFLKWFESVDSDKELRSPLMLVPVTLSRFSADAPWELTEAEDDVIDNLCLRQRLWQDYHLELPALPDLEVLEESGARLAFLESVKNAIARNARWDIEDRCALGRFAFPKVAMVQDLADHTDAVISSVLCRTIAGEAGIPPHFAFGSADDLPQASRLDDELEPGEIKAILDCDSSQLEAIVAARKGVSFVLDGPPGTGKSQTIANIIADALGMGRRVLFVSEKMAALEVVKRRLDDCGLGDFCLECHSSKANRKAVLEDLQWCLELPEEVYDDPNPKLTEVKWKRESLNSYVRSVHRPRPPLGMTPYEVYGHIARLNKTGLANRSRCRVPDPAQVDRVRLNEWQNVLGRAKDVADVIATYDSHPWRHCKLNSRSLSLENDIQHHFQTLVASSSSIENITCDLVREGILREKITLANIRPIAELLHESLTAPYVPLSWYQAPEVIANAVLELTQATEIVTNSEKDLDTYVVGVDERFPHETLLSLNDPQKQSWLSRLKSDIPVSVRRQTQFLQTLIDELRSVEKLADETQVAFTELVRELSIPISTELQVSKLPKVFELARIVASNYPLQRGWFDPEIRMKMKAFGQEATKRLGLVSSLQSKLSARIEPNQLECFIDNLDKFSELSKDFEHVEEFLSVPTIQDLKNFSATVSETSNASAETISAIDCMVQTIGLKKPIETTIKLGNTLLSLATTMMSTGVMHGAWSSQASRDELAKACDSAIEDLEDAEALQNSLKDRMSHRAFKGVSLDLVERSSAYRSSLKRLLGGFSKYRESVSELYKTSVPATKQLLEDFDILRRYHRRLRDVRELADSHSDLLPAQHNAEDSSSWRRLLSSLYEYREFFSSHPETISLLPQTELRTDGPELQENRERLAAALNMLEIKTGGTPIAPICPADAPLERIAIDLENLGESAQSCLRSWELASTFYRVAPATIADFQEDRNSVSWLRTLRDELAQLVVYEGEHLPNSFSPIEPTSWQRLSNGLDAAETIVKMTKLNDQNCEKLCEGSELNAKSLAKATRAVFNSFTDLATAFESLISKIELSPPNQDLVDPRLKSSGAMSKLARQAADEFTIRVKRLNEIGSVIQPNKDVVIDELEGDATKILRLQTAKQKQWTATNELLSRNIDLTQESDFDSRKSAIWLIHQGSRATIPHLLKTVSSDRQLQERLKQNQAELEKILNADFDVSWQFLQSVLDIGAEHSLGIAFCNVPIGEAAAHLGDLCAAVPALDGWLRFARWRRDMHALGFEILVDELLEGKFLPAEAVDCLNARFYRSLFDHVADQDIDLGEFDLEQHEKTMQRFRQLDEWEVRAAAGRIRQYQLGKEDRPRPGWYPSDSSELGILQREAQKKRRHKPLRKLFSEIPSVFQRLKPCIMMSPLSVSTFLQSKDLKFDLVIFDEASQVFPWDAMGAIYRGSQLIVAGDEKQLPPTNFFNRADIESDADGEDDDIGDYESILSLCKSIGMPNKRLRWHYRSRREPLIAFSNQHFYSGDLVTFPSVHDASSDAIHFEFVENGCWANSKNIAEAERVADLIIEHLRTKPGQSLGVIALNKDQQHAIEDAIFQRRRQDPEIDVLLDKGPSESLFVKNLENVQGDERDVIILSIGFAKNEVGKFRRDFGYLSKKGGERRLNVAITRARQSMIVVSSIRAAELDLSDIKSEGSHLVKAYLEYAEHGVDSLMRSVKTVAGSCESPFEKDVALALAHRGLNVVPQVGCGGFRIDLAISHPVRKGEFCLGVECDGASYHSSHTARDRDRIRQAVLEGLGWQIIRIWSTDWIRDPGRQIDRVTAAYERATSGIIHSESTKEMDDADNDLSAEPTLIKSKKSQHTSFAGSATFKTIEEVPDTVILDTARTILMRIGSTDWDDLVRVVTRELGFMRTGSKIRGRIEGLLQSEAAVETIRRVGDRVMPVQVA